MAFYWNSEKGQMNFIKFIKLFFYGNLYSPSIFFVLPRDYYMFMNQGEKTPFKLEGTVLMVAQKSQRV